MNFIKWYLKYWYNYTFAYIIGISMFVAYLIDVEEVFYTTPAILAVGIGIIIIGFLVGITYHMISTYNRSKE